MENKSNLSQGQNTGAVIDNKSAVDEKDKEAGKISNPQVELTREQELYLLRFEKQLWKTQERIKSLQNDILIPESESQKFQEDMTNKQVSTTMDQANNILDHPKDITQQIPPGMKEQLQVTLIDVYTQNKLLMKQMEDMKVQLSVRNQQISDLIQQNQGYKQNEITLISKLEYMQKQVEETKLNQYKVLGGAGGAYGSISRPDTETNQINKVKENIRLDNREEQQKGSLGGQIDFVDKHVKDDPFNFWNQTDGSQDRRDDKPQNLNQIINDSADFWIMNSQQQVDSTFSKDVFAIYNRDSSQQAIKPNPNTIQLEPLNYSQFRKGTKF